MIFFFLTPFQTLKM